MLTVKLHILEYLIALDFGTADILASDARD